MKTKLLILSFFFFTLITFGQCFTTLSCGEGHVAAKKTDGSIWVWGWGNWGQLNNGTGGLDEYNPITLSGTSNWQFITSGQYNTFAIKTNGTLWGCGGNLYGSLGIGSSADNSYSLIQIGTATNWKQVASGNFAALALKTDNSLWGWGQNDNYQMGNNACCANQLTPIQIGTATDWKTIAASYTRCSLAIKNNGTIWGWGSNSSGFLGDSSVTERTVPTQINPGTDWDKMSVGFEHILALKTNATLWAWGGAIWSNWTKSRANGRLLGTVSNSRQLENSSCRSWFLNRY